MFLKECTLLHLVLPIANQQTLVTKWEELNVTGWEEVPGTKGSVLECCVRYLFMTDVDLLPFS